MYAYCIITSAQVSEVHVVLQISGEATPAASPAVSWALSPKVAMTFSSHGFMHKSVRKTLFCQT